jgi:hypothetical protein
MKMTTTTRASHFAVTLAALTIAGAAHAQSFIPGNYVDDFGPVVSDRSVAADRGARPEQMATRTAGSPIPANYIDDFGTLASSTVSDPAEVPIVELLGQASTAAE